MICIPLQPPIPKTCDLFRSFQGLHGALGEAQILPCLRFGNQRAQQISWVIGDDHWNTFVPMESAPKTAYACIGIEQIPGGGLAERDDQLRLDQLDLPGEVRLATLRFVVRRLAITRWTAFYDVGYEDVPASLQTDGGQHIIQQLACLPHEGFT